MRAREHPLQSVLLLLVAVPQAATGLWAVVAPRGWYDGFPGLGHTWISAYGPYDDHLATDAGAGLLALGVLLGWAALAAPRVELRRAIVVFLLFAAVHLGFHATAMGRLTRLDDAVSITSLALSVAVPLAVLLSLGRAPASGGPLEPAAAAPTTTATTASGSQPAPAPER